MMIIPIADNVRCRMNTEHLKYFITVAETGSINRAAQKLYISQPHLGKIIHDLEDELGAVLLQRSRKGVVLTPEGAEFLRHAEKIVQECGKIRQLGTTGASASSLEVSMTKYSHIMECFIAVVLRHRDDPQFVHRLNEGSPFDVIDDISSHFFEVGVINFDNYQRARVRAALEEKRLEYRRLARMKPHILVAEDHPLIRAGRPVTLENLADYPFVRFLGEFEDLTGRFLQQPAGGGQPPRRVVYTRARSSLLSLIGSSDFYGLGIDTFEKQISAYKVCSIPIENAGALEFGCVLKQDSPPRPIAREFIAELKKRFRLMDIGEEPAAVSPQ